MLFQTHLQELDFLQHLGFTVNPLNSNANNVDEIWDQGQKLYKQKDSLTYPIDGLVVKTNNLQDVKIAGVVGKTPRAWSAVKFAPQEVTTQIIGVSWQIGRTGKVTPVADLQPVELSGTTVKRATLHNFKEFIDSDLHSGDSVVVRKAGEIIPEVIHILTHLRKENSESFTAPLICPECSSELEKSITGIDVFCLNSQRCPIQIKERLSYFCSRNIGNISGLSDKQIERFIELYQVFDIYDLYTLPFDKIGELDGFGEKSVTNLQTSIQNSREISDYKFLAGLSIDGVGPEVAKLICQKIVDKES